MKQIIEEVPTLQESDTVKEPEEKVEMLFYVDKAPTKFINDEVDDSSQDATEDNSSQEMTEANVDCENTNLQADELIPEESTDIDTNIQKLEADQLPCTPQQTVRKRKCSSARSVRTSKLCKPPVKPLTPHVEGKVTKVRKSSAARTNEFNQKKLCRNQASLMESPGQDRGALL
uniref:Uncharacterized protein n=1 Tax=Ciona savignyi TaxID=51511 RepID=H2Z4I9_CIOSA